MNITFSQFKQMRKHRHLSSRELQRAWQQHLNSRRSGGSSGPAPARGRNTGGQPGGGSSRANSGVSACSLEYASALVNPHETPPACLPNEFSQNSQKTKIFVRGSVVIGTAGFGWMVSRPIPSNDNGSVHATNDTYAGTASTTMVNGATTDQFNSNSPYASTDFSDDTVAFRVVAHGLRARWGGTELDRGGKVVCFEEPEHLDLINGTSNYSQQLIESFDRAKSVRWSDGGWHGVTYQPVQPAEIHYHTTVNTGNAHHWMLAICFTGKPGSIIDFESTTHLEFIGRAVRGKTPTPYDSAYQVVINRLAQVGTVLIDRATNLGGTALLNIVRQQFGLSGVTRFSRIEYP